MNFGTQQVAHWSLALSNKMLFCSHQEKCILFLKTISTDTLQKRNPSPNGHICSSANGLLEMTCCLVVTYAFCLILEILVVPLGAVVLSSLKVGLQLCVNARLSLQGWYFIVWHSFLRVGINTSLCPETDVRWYCDLFFPPGKKYCR